MLSISGLDALSVPGGAPYELSPWPLPRLEEEGQDWGHGM